MKYERLITRFSTFRGFVESDFDQVAEFFGRAVDIATDLKVKTGGKIKDFRAALDNGGDANIPELVALKKEVVQFSRSFPAIGY